MGETYPIRWMVVFYHARGNWREEADFPQVEFWQPTLAIAREEAARVLVELREQRDDQREWVAAGHPDPLQVAAGRHPGGQWILRYVDLGREKVSSDPEDKRRRSTKSAAGAWRGLIDGEQLNQTLSGARRGGLTLLTNNRRHFHKLAGLSIISAELSGIRPGRALHEHYQDYSGKHSPATEYLIGVPHA